MHAEFSNHALVETVMRAMLAGACDFLTKPIHDNDICDIWQHVLRRQLDLDATAAADADATLKPETSSFARMARRGREDLENWTAPTKRALKAASSRSRAGLPRRPSSTRRRAARDARQGGQTAKRNQR
jgi:DNA-binding response OmpR family regulator